ncbi:glycosyl hydrolase family 28-related protein [Ruegeria sp. HKCCD8929]|uniref:glycosyl hydrolase family 28-related protein n=1 Tax=Ruegeria sp. HKCCD8929 TaxID=2683006 RepID=UPI0014894F17|nr:glycosyl hydrolase family 28-related protein [Ruegeria sp. HKCCD8929]
MNKAITDGIVFTPPAFKNGLSVWSSGDGTAGSDTYAGSGIAAYVPADADFGGCLELQKISSTQKLRYMGQTPLLPGCYLQIKARVKAVSGPLPSVRIAGWAGGAGDVHVAGLTEQGSAVALTNYGEVFEVTAIVGTGHRNGVDMPWGAAAIYGHFGLNLEGPNGSVVRIDDIEIVDATGVFLRDMIGVVDVRDYGARGDGVTDDSAAFEAADQAAEGRKVLVPAGTYLLAETVSMSSEIEFEGTVTMPDDKMLLLTKNYDLPTYISAFGDEALAFRKAFQALLNNSDHESLDLGGRKVAVTGPIDMQAAVPNKTGYSTRRVIRNGQFDVLSSTAWDTQTYTSQATYSPSDALKLTNVANIANIPVGALVQGAGVGREVYVRSKNVGAGEITLSSQLFDAAGTQTFTFRDFKYLLDFKGFNGLSKFGMEDIEFQCNSRCSAIRLAPSGATFVLKNCFISRPKDRGISSIGTGCQGMLIDGCQFLSAEDAETVPNRSSIALNANANDIKLRHNRATRFRHFAVLSGTNNMVLGNHFFQGDSVANGTRTGGLVLTSDFIASTVAENYVDNCFIEWTNEHTASPDFVTGFSFSALSITDNIFMSGDVAPWFSYIVVRPYGTGHFLNGLSVTGNKFRSTDGKIDRAERVDTTHAGLDYGRFVNVVYEANTYHNVTTHAVSPLRLKFAQNSAAKTWTIGSGNRLPFWGRARGCDSVVAVAPLLAGANAVRYQAPYVQLQQGTNKDQIRLNWSEALKGEVSVIMRVDG